MVGWAFLLPSNWLLQQDAACHISFQNGFAAPVGLLWISEGEKQQLATIPQQPDFKTVQVLDRKSHAKIWGFGDDFGILLEIWIWNFAEPNFGFGIWG